MSYQPQMFEMPTVAFDLAAIEKKYPLWAAQSKNWKRFDRIYTNEKQIISLAEVLETTKYLSSDTLLHPSIPEFTVISDNPQIGANTYVCYRKSLLKEEDILHDDFGPLTRRMIPVVDAYVYLNNNGTLCNYVVTLCKCILEIDGRKNTSTGQFISYVHDDPVSQSYANYDPQYVLSSTAQSKCFTSSFKWFHSNARKSSAMDELLFRSRYRRVRKNPDKKDRFVWSELFIFQLAPHRCWLKV